MMYPLSSPVGSISNPFISIAERNSTIASPVAWQVAYVNIDGAPMRTEYTPAGVWMQPYYSGGWSTLPASTTEGYVVELPRITGTGRYKVSYTSSRWSVLIGENPATMIEPLSVVSAVNTTAVDSLFTTMPAGMFGDGETWVIDMPTETSTNTGNDSHGLLINGNLVDSASAPASTLSQCKFGLTRNGNMLRKTVAQSVAGLRTNLYFFGGINFASTIALTLRITPSTVGNTSYIRRASLLRIV